MKYLFVISILFVFLASCEENINDYDLPYEKKLVVRCILQAGEPVDDITISKTIPPLEEATEESVALDSVNGFISDGENNYPLIKKGMITYEAQGLIPQPGKEYKIEISSENMTAYASTKVPDNPVIKKMFYLISESDDYWYNWNIKFFVKIVPKSDCAYAGVLIREGFDGKVSYPAVESAKFSDTIADGSLNLLFQNYYTDDTTSVPWFDNYSIGILSYDSDFYDYFRTRYNSELDWEFFGSSGTNVLWNIEGDGIGLFLGKNFIEKEVD